MIRKAVPGDADSIGELAAALWPEHTVEAMAEEMRSLLSDDESAVFLAVTDERPAAFAQCQLRHDYVEGTETSPVGYLEGIFVSEPYRHQGIAGDLLHECEQWAKDKGCREFASDCELTNEGSRLFHLRMGFAEANRLICFTKNLQ